MKLDVILKSRAQLAVSKKWSSLETIICVSWTYLFWLDWNVCLINKLADKYSPDMCIMSIGL